MQTIKARSDEPEGDEDFEQTGRRTSQSSHQRSELSISQPCIDADVGDLLSKFLEGHVTDPEAVLFEDHMLACLFCREEFLEKSGLGKEVEEYTDAFFDQHRHSETKPDHDPAKSPAVPKRSDEK